MLYCCDISIPASAQTIFHYEGRRMTSSDTCLYVSSNVKTKPVRFTFHSVEEALRFAEQRSDEGKHRTLYIEPSVYWLDDPDDPEIRRPRTGNTPFAMEVRLSDVSLIGLGTRADDVVLAVNRGQTQGADGNFTMFSWEGSRVSAENITFGNYCNVDLIYERNPQMNRNRRKQAIVQAQIAICHGDDFRFKNCRFISRLNLCPFVGAPHTTYNDCYFECTDDALCGTGTYKNCRFTFFSSKPFYTTDKNIGVRFYDCDIHSKTHGTQYLTKVSGPVIMERCRWTSDDPEIKIEWNKRPDPQHFCRMTDCTLNGKPLYVPTPTEPLPVALPPFPLQQQPRIIQGQWTIDCYKPSDTADYPWQPDPTLPAWGYAEGMDGAEGSWGLVQLQKGARLMFTDNTPKDAPRSAIVTLDPCKGPGQGFGSATGQYLDICICFDTQTLTGYGLRFIRTPDYDHAVETYLVEYQQGTITAISKPERCDLFKRGCTVTLTAEHDVLKAIIQNIPSPILSMDEGENYNKNKISLKEQTLSATMQHPNDFRGFHLQHTGSTGASATVIKSIILK